MKENRKEITIVTECPICHHANEIMVNEEDYFAWVFDGELVQNAFPYLTADEREMLINGICPKCWAQTFGDEEEEDPEDWEDDVDECGYNPYMGCYDFDC